MHKAQKLQKTKKIQIPPIYIEVEKESSKHSTPRPLPLQTGLPVKFKVEE